MRCAEGRSRRGIVKWYRLNTFLSFLFFIFLFFDLFCSIFQGNHSISFSHCLWLFYWMKFLFFCCHFDNQIIIHHYYTQMNYELSDKINRNDKEKNSYSNVNFRFYSCSFQEQTNCKERKRYQQYYRSNINTEMENHIHFSWIWKKKLSWKRNSQ